MNITYQPTIVHADTVKPDECFPAVLLFRGSGESKITDVNNNEIKTYYNSNGNTVVQTNGYEGGKIGRLLENFALRTNAQETVSKTRFIGVDYPALPVLPDFQIGDDYNALDQLKIRAIRSMEHISAYQDSYNEGALRAINIIKDDMARGCNTQYTFVGYSQGVISARIASSLLDNNPEKIVSTYAIGDPYQKKNGAYSELQKSPANTGYDSTGLLRNTPMVESEFEFLMPNELINEYDGTYINIKDSDSVFYRNDEFVSRSLCHDKDPICTSALHNFDPHSNYFLKNKYSPEDIETAGDVDLEYEISAFDLQVQALANSAQHNPRARTLTKTPSVSSSSTIYNLANARRDDKCSWDEGNDGTYEAIDVSCEPYEYKSSTGRDKLKLRVTDSFGTDYFFETDEKVFEVEQIENILSLDPNQWYQFETFDGKCVQWNTDAQDVIWDFAWNAEAVQCKNVNNSVKAEDSTQVFKAMSVPNNNSQRRIVSGYDDDYSWGRDNMYQFSDEKSSEYLTVMPNSSQDYFFEPTLTGVKDGKAYYSFPSGEDCLTRVGNSYGASNLIMEKCDKNDNRQLFAPIKVDGVFGAESIERDTTPPSTPSNIRVELSGVIATIYWDKIFDRGYETNYEVYLYNPDTKENELLPSYVLENNSFSLDTDDIPENGKNIYTIKSIDLAGHTSQVLYSISPQPWNIYSPARPALIGINNDSTVATLRIPKYDTDTIRGVQVFDNGEYIGTFTGSKTKTTNIAVGVEPNTTHTYYYKYEVADRITSEKSSNLKVVVP